MRVSVRQIVCSHSICEFVKGQNCPARDEMRFIIFFDPRPTPAAGLLCPFLSIALNKHARNHVGDSEMFSKILFQGAGTKAVADPAVTGGYIWGLFVWECLADSAGDVMMGGGYTLGRGSLSCRGRARARDFHWGFWIFLECYLFAVDSHRRDCAPRLFLKVRYLFPWFTTHKGADSLYNRL